MPWPMWIPSGLLAASLVMLTHRLDGSGHVAWWLIATPAGVAMLLIGGAVAAAKFVGILDS